MRVAAVEGFVLVSRFSLRAISWVALLVVVACGGGQSTSSSQADALDASQVSVDAAASQAPADDAPASDDAVDTPSARATAAAVTMPALPPAAAESPFGVAPSASSSNNPSLWASDIASSGVQWVRGFNSSPTLGAVNTLRSAGFSVSGILGYHPTNDITAWRSYVARAAQTYQGQVALWEVWNEPPNFTPNTPPQEYATMVVNAYEAAKAVDPAVKVGLAAQSVNLNYLDQALVAGAKDHFDFITVHPYEVAAMVNQGFEAQYMSIVPTIRKMLAARNPDRAQVPVIFTEVGQPVSTALPVDAQADLLVKLYAMGIAQGAQRTHWFEPLDGDSGPFGLIGANHTKRPSLIALQTLISQLGQKPRYYGPIAVKNKHFGFLFAGPQSMVLVAWAKPNTTDTVTFTQTMTMIDPRTGASRQGTSLTLTNSPVLIVPKAPVPTWATRALANAKKPFPWDGDYSTAIPTTAASVSITAPSSEKGLHQAQAPALRGIDGLTVRDASTRAAQMFTVDPVFLSYTTTPIRITAVVRRNSASTAGFNVKYESVSGWKSVRSWNTVPSSTEWTTLSWSIPDPQFVGKWGYHFAFDSDSTQYSNYSIKSVTVTKE